MNKIYTDNDEIVEFISKAQQKIASLSTLVVSRGLSIPRSIDLAMELIDFIECLDSTLCNWTVDEVIQWIHEYNHRADLSNLSYLNIYGYTTNIIISTADSDIIDTTKVSDFEVAVNQLIKRYLHNQLNGLQGGNLNERYHLSKQGYDYVNSQINPTTSSSVTLTLNTNGVKWPSGYYELGTTIGVVDLIGSITYGTDNKATYFEYNKNNTLLGTRTSSPSSNQQPNPTSDTLGIKVDSSYSFNAYFNDGLKTATQSVVFRQPMYYGIITRSKLTSPTLDSALYSTTIKDVRDRGEMELSFTLSDGNTALEYSDSKTLFLFIPASWGKFTSAINSTFNFVNDFSVMNHDMTLADGSKVPGILVVYTTQVEGLVTFKFNW